MVVFAALWLGSPAAAHPEQMRIVSHRTWVVLTEDTVRVDYYVELPLGAGHHPDEPAADLQSLDEVANGLLLQIDGVTTPLEPVPGYEPELRAKGTRVGCRIVLGAPLPPGAVHDVVVSNANYPDLPGYFSNAIDVTTAMEVTASNLVEREGWRVVRDWNGGWGIGEGRRALSASVRPLDGPGWRATRWMTRTSGQLRSSADAMPRPAWVRWLEGSWSPGVAVAFLATGAALGGTAGAAGRVSALGAAAVALVALAGVSGGAGQGGAVVGVASLAALAGWRLARDRRIGVVVPLVAAVFGVAAAGLRAVGPALLY